MKMESLKDLYVEQLEDLYNAEHQILKALPKMADAASHPELKQAFQSHEQQTKNHVSRLEQVFDDMGQKPKGKECKAMTGLMKEGDEMLEKKGDPDAKDAGLITSAQRVEHYEIAGYGSVRTYADELGYGDQAELLQQTLDEEGETDHKLSRIAESRVNLDAER